ncbi:hypothetical protein ABZS79_31510 [Streptomyces griseoloalbus]|jgi:hypothetical protein|uniref:hypothetical protein n=1 Tax=Streptomyces TaxID=1883 RepID=UPI0033A56CBA
MNAAASTTTVRTKTGETATLTRAAVMEASRTEPDYTAYAPNDVWVVADIGGRLIPVIQLVRAALGAEPHNTNEAEVRIRELGFQIFIKRLYTPGGQPVRLTQTQLKDARP